MRLLLEMLRSHLVAEIDLRLDYFEPMQGYVWEWNTEILSHAVASALACFPSYHFEQIDDALRLIDYEGSDQFLSALTETGWEYAVARRLAKRKKEHAPASAAHKPPSIGAQIKALRRESRMTEEKLAEAIGQGKRTVQRHINGELTPRLPTIALYEEAFSKALKREVKIDLPS
jgi:DNA-binding transcriptional regulator YiaG